MMSAGGGWDNVGTSAASGLGNTWTASNRKPVESKQSIHPRCRAHLLNRDLSPGMSLKCGFSPACVPTCPLAREAGLTSFPFFSVLISVHLRAQECGNFLVLRFLFMHISSGTSSFGVICSPNLPAASEARVWALQGAAGHSLEEGVCQNDLHLSFPSGDPSCQP